MVFVSRGEVDDACGIEREPGKGGVGGGNYKYPGVIDKGSSY